MTGWKRTIVLVVVAAGLATGAVLYVRRGPKAARSAGVPELISQAPAEASFLAYADLNVMRSSPFFAQLAALAPQMPVDRDYAEFVRATGFDYSRDLDRVLLLAQPNPPGNFTIALAEGRFDREKIARYALRSGRLERQNGVEVYVVRTNTPGKAAAFAFLQPNRIALADGPSLAPVLAPRVPGGPDAQMRERIARLAGAAVFAVGRVGQVSENVSVDGLRSDQFSNLVRSLRWFSLAVRPEDDRMRVALEGECDTSENARQLAGALEGFRMLGQAALADPRTRQRLPLQTAATLDGLLRAAQVSREGQHVRLLLELTPAILNAATGKNPASHSSAR